MKKASNRISAVSITRLPGSLPQCTIAEDFDHAAVAASALQNLTSLKAEHLLKDALWRDILALTDTLRTFFGAERIEAAWTDTSAHHQPREFALIPNTSRIARLGPKICWIECTFSFQMQSREGSGIAKLVPNQDGWKIWAMSTILEGINGFGNVDALDPVQPVPRPVQAIPYPAHLSLPNGNPEALYRDCVVIGAGMAGLSVAGRLKALGVSCLALDRNSEIGGNWTTRYESVKLHTSKESGQMPFGRTWGPEFPYFLSGHDLAQGYQKFVDQFGLDVWLSTNVDSAAWNDEEKTWTVETTSHNLKKSLTTRHLVLAIGAGGQTPIMPKFPNQESFGGVVLHSVDYRSPSSWKGKAGIIIGTGNSAHDVAEDMLDAGLTSVTMVQRNPTPILPIGYYKAIFDVVYNDKIPTERADRMWLTGPIAISRQLALLAIKARASNDSEYFDALERANFKTDRFCDLFHILYERLGGHYLDVGASAKVAQGQIKVKSDAALSQYTSTGLSFADGSRLDAEIIVFATGFEGNMRHMASQIVGQEVADQLEDFFHIDAEGELLGAWKPMRHPGIWYTGGAIGQARFFSRFLALQIKADLEGKPLVPYTKYRAD